LYPVRLEASIFTVPTWDSCFFRFTLLHTVR
jgi:hypothetical protein